MVRGAARGAAGWLAPFAIGIIFSALSFRIDQSRQRLQAERICDCCPAFQPVDGKPPHDTVRTWARGFRRAMRLAPADWIALAENSHLEPILAPLIGFIEVGEAFEPAADINDRLDWAAANIPHAIDPTTQEDRTAPGQSARRPTTDPLPEAWPQRPVPLWIRPKIQALLRTELSPSPLVISGWPSPHRLRSGQGWHAAYRRDRNVGPRRTGDACSVARLEQANPSRARQDREDFRNLEVLLQATSIAMARSRPHRSPGATSPPLPTASNAASIPLCAKNTLAVVTKNVRRYCPNHSPIYHPQLRDGSIRAQVS